MRGMKAKYVLTAVVILLVAAAFAISYRPGRQDARSVPQAEPAPEVAFVGPQTAGDTVIRYFGLLNAGDFREAARYHVGYEAVRNWNPDVDPFDYPLLLERGCTQNGWNCLLVKQVLRSEPIPEGERVFVEFQNADGTRFERGPCCGEEGGIVETEFAFETMWRGNGFVMMTDPVYTP